MKRGLILAVIIALIVGLIIGYFIFSSPKSGQYVLECPVATETIDCSVSTPYCIWVGENCPNADVFFTGQGN